MPTYNKNLSLPPFSQTGQDPLHTYSALLNAINLLNTIAGNLSNGNILTGHDVADLPVYPQVREAWFAYATNGRKVGEAAGNGTGVPIYFSNDAWRVFSTDAQVQS